MKKTFVLLLVVSLIAAMIAAASAAFAESGGGFDEGIFADAGYKTDGDIFTGQKVLYKPDREVVMLDYTTKGFTLGSKIDKKIFGKKANEEGEMPAWTQGDKTQFHKSQTGAKCYPFVVCDSAHEVPYSFVVALSLPPADNWLGVQEPYGIMIATDRHIYTLKRYLPSSQNFYHDIVFMTMDETGIEMFRDMLGSGVLTIRATSFDGATVDLPQRVPVAGTIGEGVDIVGSVWSEGVQDVLDAWELYVQAGGAGQDLSIYANAVEAADRPDAPAASDEGPSGDEAAGEAASAPTEQPEPEPTPEPAPVYETLEKGSKGDAVVKLQKQLIALGYLDGSADGDFGKGTAAAVEKFQADEGLPVNGIADNETQVRLFAKEIPFHSDVRVASVKTSTTYSGAFLVYIQLENIGKSTIDRVDFHVRSYNAYGDLMTYKGSKYVDGFYASDIKPGKKMPSDYYYNFTGLKGATKFSICIYRYHYKNGETVDISPENQVWEMFG